VSPVRRVWVTRAEPGARATAERLRALGFEPLVAPLLEVRLIPGGPIDLTGVAALAFTSANGVAAFAARSPERALPVFAVGVATAAAARAAGFTDVVSADGDVEALAPVIAARRPGDGTVLHLAPTEPAGDLVAALTALGVNAGREIVYETVALPPDAEFVAQLPTFDAVLLHSPKAARALADGLRVADPAVVSNLRAFCLSPNVAAPLADLGLAAVHVAAAPNDTALLDEFAAAARSTKANDGQATR
jgi:uroporphyrinogen-III synthase